MTLDEAIKHCEVVARENERFCYTKGGKGGYFNEDTDWNNRKCAKEHRQLAAWLTELKQLRKQMIHSEKPNKWINKPQESEDEKVIRIKKGTLKVRTGRYVIYDVEWLKTHFNTTEAKIYGQPQPKAEHKQKTGHWIEHKHGGIEHIECSKCRCWFLRKDLIRNSYCPNCGSYNGGTK